MGCGLPVHSDGVVSFLVVITLAIVIGIFLIAFIVFTIFVLKHRNEKRQRLAESLVSNPDLVLRVS